MLKRLDLRGWRVGDPLQLPRPALDAEGPVEAVRSILRTVKEGGDKALRDFSLQFDGVEIDEFRVPPEDLTKALNAIPTDLRDALTEASESIAEFHAHQRPEPEPYTRDGITVRELSLPVDRAGVYAPGGRAKYPSSVLMTAIPARVAGVGSIACCVPPGPDGTLPDEILAAASLAGIDEVYRVGGAQAIAAFTYGTESIAKVDVIVGPGSKWVSIAQREVRGVVGVPAAFAGPSEVVVIGDESCPPEWSAVDVIVQAEHGPDGLAWFVTWSESVADAVTDEIERLVSLSPRREDTESTLSSGGYVVLVDNPECAMAIANSVAPEHLEILTNNAEELLPLVRHAGAIFLGPLSPASIGDYIAGPSHVLPTFATARFGSVLGIEDFLRRVHAVHVDERGLDRVAPHVAAIANAEGLPAHAESVLMRAGKATWSA